MLQLFIFMLSLALASGGNGPSERPKFTTIDEYGTAKKMIEAKDYSSAIPHLKKALEDDRNNADIYNYLGFAHRKTGQLLEAFEFYNKALAINPNHLGAHEYLGEAYLQNNERERAKGELQKLEMLCGKNCNEYLELSKAIGLR